MSATLSFYAYNVALLQKKNSDTAFQKLCHISV